MKGGRPRRALAIMVAMSALVPVSDAAAESIVYLRDFNVWRMAPDGSGQTQITRDGTAMRRYGSVSQSDDGTIAAGLEVSSNCAPSSGSFEQPCDRADVIVVMNAAGAVQGTPVNPDPCGRKIEDVALSHDATKVAFYSRPARNQSCPEAFSTGSVIANVNTPSLLSRTTINNCRDPSWLDSAQIVVACDGDPSTIATLAPGSNTPTTWFPDDSIADQAAHPVVTRQMNRIAYSPHGGSRTRMTVSQLAGAPPAPPGNSCFFDGLARAGQVQFRNPTWSPDGAQLAWEHSDGHKETSGEEMIYSSAVASAPGCGVVPRELAKGGDPSWGARGGAGAGAPGALGSPGSKVPPPKLTTKVKRRYDIKQALRRGVPVTVTCEAACTVLAQIVLNGRVAGSPKLKKGAPLGGALKEIPARKARRVTLKFTPAAKKQLRRARKLKVKLALAWATPTSSVGAATKNVVLEKVKKKRRRR